MKQTWHLWVQNSETGEVRRKIVKGIDFGYAGRSAFEFLDILMVKTKQIWHIMSVNDVDFTCDPKKPIT